MSGFDLFSIGHSNMPAERFVAMLRAADVNAVADVRSAPVSRFFPWFSGKNLAALLAREGITYLPYGETLGGRPRHPRLYRDGIADYEAMALAPEFQAGLDGLRSDAARCRVCLMCAEREPLDCHRCLLVARALTERGFAIGHLLHDGTIEPHNSTEQRLLALAGASDDLFVTGQRARLAAAYRDRGPSRRVSGEGKSPGGEVVSKASMMLDTIRLILLVLVVSASPAFSQDAAAPAADTDTLDPTPPGSLNPAPLPPLANPDSPSIPAKELFARKPTPFPGPPRSIGSYADGCLAGAVPLPIDGPTWQVMRLSRNRNWGNPNLIAFLERFADNAKKAGWNGLLIGDMSQPRGGPMITGHASHQVGLDADIWFTPMPDHVQTREEREFTSAVDMVAADRLDVDPKVWTHTRTELIRTAAQDPATARIFVNAAIKKAMCREAGSDREWLSKVRPWWGHAEHFHVRIGCPADSSACKPQPPPEAGDGCGHALDFWFKESTLHPAPPLIPEKPKPALTLARLPAQCKQIVSAP